MLIYWEICLRTDFQSRQTLYTLLCRTCATLSCKAVVLGIPIIVLAMIIKILIFTYFFPLLKDTIFQQSQSPSQDTAAHALRMSLASCCRTYKPKASGPYQTTVPRVLQALARRCDAPRAVSRRVSGALPMGERVPPGSSTAESFRSAVQAPRLCSFNPRIQVCSNNSPCRALPSHRCPNPSTCSYRAADRAHHTWPN